MNGKPRIVQCSREIADGGGVSGVAAQLEAGFRAAGYECERVTLETVGLSPRHRYTSRAVNKLYLIRDVLWYTIAGTLYTKLRYSRRDTVVICHNDTVSGDIYVNHGLHKLVVLGSPQRGRILLRNPLHWFILVREELRHRLRVHRHIVTLSSRDTEDIVRLYPASRGRVTQFANGVRVERFAGVAAHRREIRRRAGLGEDDVVLLFVGHEFDRKGLSPTMEALRRLDRRIRLWVVGGTESMIATARAEAARLGVAERTTFFGTRREGIEEFFAAADLFVLPSHYEAAALVVLEAMAAGAVPVATPVGAAPDLIEHGGNGYLVERDPEAIAAAVRDATQTPGRLAELSKLAAETVKEYDWSRIVERYTELVERIHAGRRA
jgi:UDP-glucose:(heptosyl)LPS alpha-1,3-glucosyltransferase